MVRVKQIRDRVYLTNREWRENPSLRCPQPTLSNSDRRREAEMGKMILNDCLFEWRTNPHPPSMCQWQYYILNFCRQMRCDRLIMTFYVIINITVTYCSRYIVPLWGNRLRVASVIRNSEANRHIEKDRERAIEYFCNGRFCVCQWDGLEIVKSLRVRVCIRVHSHLSETQVEAASL